MFKGYYITPEGLDWYETFGIKDGIENFILGLLGNKPNEIYPSWLIIEAAKWEGYSEERIGKALNRLWKVEISRCLC